MRVTESLCFQTKLRGVAESFVIVVVFVCREEVVTFFTRACERRDPHSFVRDKNESREREREIFLFSCM